MVDKKERKVEKVPLAEELHGSEVSAYQRYRRKAAGDLGFTRFCLYETFNLLLANLGGAVGYVGRKFAAKRLFAEAGSGLILGRGLVIRHPGRIFCGKNVAIDGYAYLDAIGSGEKGVRLGDGVIISRNSILQAKTGPIAFGARVDAGANCVFSSVSGITIGAATIIAGNCYIGGARYYHDRLDLPIMDQGNYSRGEIVIGAHSWLGAGAVILDGVRLGRGVIVGAGSVVTRDAPDYAILAGVPARILRLRGENQEREE